MSGKLSAVVPVGTLAIYLWWWSHPPPDGRLPPPPVASCLATRLAITDAELSAHVRTLGPITKEDRVVKPKRPATSQQNPYPSVIANVQRIANAQGVANPSTRISMVGQSGGLAYLNSMTGAMKILDSFKAPNLGAGLLATQSAAFPTPMASLTAFDTNGSLKAPMGLANQQSGADRLRPLLAGVQFGPNVGLIASWLGTQPGFGVDLSAALRDTHQSVASSVRPIAALLGGLDQTSSLTKALLGVGATNDALNGISGLGNAATAIASIAKLVKPYELPNIGLMTNLAATRALLDTMTPLTRSVDRIGKGWASLGDRIVRGDLELAPLMPSSNRLTTKAYQLDILFGQDESTDDEELLTTRKDDDDVVAECLARLNPRLCDRWNGMWDRMDERGADWQSQAANSAVELIDGVLKSLAPDDTVRGWQVASGLHNDPGLYLKDKPNGPTRRLRLYYLGHEYRVSQVTINGLFMGVPATIDALQGMKHGAMSDELFETAVSLLGEVITMLVPNRRR